MLQRAARRFVYEYSTMTVRFIILLGSLSIVNALLYAQKLEISRRQRGAALHASTINKEQRLLEKDVKTMQAIYAIEDSRCGIVPRRRMNLLHYGTRMCRWLTISTRQPFPVRKSYAVRPYRQTIYKKD